MDPLRRPRYTLLNRDLLDSYEIAKEKLGEITACYASVLPVTAFPSFGSSVVINASSAGTILHILTSSMAKFQAVKDLFKRVDVRGISLDTLILIAKSPTSERKCLQAVDNHIDNSEKCSVDSPSILQYLESNDNPFSGKKDCVGLDCSECIRSRCGTYESDSHCVKLSTTTLT